MRVSFGVLHAHSSLRLKKNALRRATLRCTISAVYMFVYEQHKRVEIGGGDNRTISNTINIIIIISVLASGGRVTRTAQVELKHEFTASTSSTMSKRYTECKPDDLSTFERFFFNAYKHLIYLSKNL